MSERGEALSVWERETAAVGRSSYCFSVLPLVLILSLRKLRGFILYEFPEENYLHLLSLVLCLCFIAVYVILLVKYPKIIMLAWMIKSNMVSELTWEEDTVQLWKLGIPTFWISLHKFFSKRRLGWLSYLGCTFLLKQNLILSIFSFWPDTTIKN